MHAFGLADAAEVRAQRDIAKFGKGARQCLRYLVVQGAAVKRMRMRHERDAARGRARFGRVDQGFNATGRAGNETLLGAAPAGESHCLNARLLLFG